jgi:UDP-4-amino-4-deoxy-L-arabinose-oxoglutarate aminotransferase
LNLVAQLVRRHEADEVIIPAMTFVSTAMAFKTAGLRPVPVDVDPDTLLLDVTSVERQITSRTRAIVVVHLYGQQQELGPLRALCDKHGISLVEDCAHRIGRLSSPPIGDFACYSFNAVKEAPAGEGGLLWGRNISFEARARESSYLGMGVDTWQRAAATQHRPYEFGHGEGLKCRLTDVAATFVLACLPHLETWRSQRRAIFARYEARLREASPTSRWFLRSSEDSYLMFVLRLSARDRERVRQSLASAGIATSTHYPSLSRHPLWVQPQNGCPVAEMAESELLTLPCFPDLDTATQERVLSAWEVAWK